MFLPVKKVAHDNFFYKITTKKLRKFAIFHVFCKTVRKIAGKPLFWPNFYCTTGLKMVIQIYLTFFRFFLKVLEPI